MGQVIQQQQQAQQMQQQQQLQQQQQQQQHHHQHHQHQHLSVLDDDRPRRRQNEPEHPRPAQKQVPLKEARRPLQEPSVEIRGLVSDGGEAPNKAIQLPEALRKKLDKRASEVKESANDRE